MRSLELNKKRHAVRTFNDRPVNCKDLRAAIGIAALAPSASNIQPWKFVVVKDKKAKLAEHLPEIDRRQVEQAQYVVVIFTDTDSVRHSRRITRIGVKSLSNDMLGYCIEILPARSAESDDKRKSEYLALNAGIAAMNLVLALTGQDISSNTILGLDKSSTNDILEVDKCFHPELSITISYSNNKPEPSYRLPVDEITERR